jgi:hypothetical protein
MCDMIDLKVHAMSLVCGQLSPFLSLVERLDLTADYWPSKPHKGGRHSVLPIPRTFPAIYRHPESPCIREA